LLFFLLRKLNPSNNLEELVKNCVRRQKSCSVAVKSDIYGMFFIFKYVLRVINNNQYGNFTDLEAQNHVGGVF